MKGSTGGQLHGVPVLERLMHYVEKTDHCWEWTGYSDQGYGRMTVDGRHEWVHRLMYRFAYGSIPDGMTVDHLCFNPLCVRPSHLRLLTHIENCRNQRSSMREFCVNGHPYDEVNTYWRPNGQRDCRICTRHRKRKQVAARKEKA